MMVARKIRTTNKRKSRMKNGVSCIDKGSGIPVEGISILDEEGPRPMKNLRPTQKKPTGAEKFRNEHDAEYETRGNPSQDKVNQVHQHSRVYPKMYNELEKKRSTANPAPLTSSDSTPDDSPQIQNMICCNCLSRLKQINKSAETKNKIEKSRKTKAPAISKRKRFNTARRIFNYNKVTKNKSCQYTYSPLNLPISNKYKCCQNEKARESNHVPSYPSEDRISKSDISIEKDIDISEYPDTSLQSLVSYHSILSMDREPMVKEL